MTRIKGQSEAARNARLDRGCCPTHGIGMSQIAGWWYPLDEPPFTLVSCDRNDCDIICKATGPDEVLSEPLSPEELRAMSNEHSFRSEIGESIYFMRVTLMNELRKRRDAGLLSAEDYDALERSAELMRSLARPFVAALDATAPKEKGE